ncbi:DUF998 domain-containing protein [Nocardia harenae]|uniref:DUF998 domain-containing protein n=1 Tax=Nocardia harenae TaxID=358707 RepID=UPI001FE0A887|nr:DUF998 domain-containing protein [Nocardia harenae]
MLTSDRGPATWFVAIALTVAGLSYSAWVLQFALPLHADPVHSFLSELDAEGKPYRWVFSTADTVAGVLAALAAAVALARFPRRPLTVAGWIALLCFGAATVADARVPLRDCADCGAGGLFPQLRQPHALTSTLAVTGIAVAAFALTLAAFRYRYGPALREFGAVALAVGSAATVWMLVADNLSGDYLLGVAQRIQVTAMSLWLLALALEVARAAPPRR